MVDFDLQNGYFEGAAGILMFSHEWGNRSSSETSHFVGDSSGYKTDSFQ